MFGECRWSRYERPSASPRFARYQSIVRRRPSSKDICARQPKTCSARLLRRLAVDRRPGVHHVTNQGAVSWYELAREVLVAAGRDPSAVRAITTAHLQPARAAARPANSVLDNAVLRLSGLPLVADFREPLVQLLRVLTA